MSLPSKVRKAKGGENPQSTGKSVKSNESKQDTSKPSDKSQPTAEQMRIAQIIENKTEDPALKEKLKQVMDATQKSIDEAYTALHDCDNDPNRAVNLLLEGIESEWSTSSKKKKNRTSGDKVSKEKEVPQETPPEEDMSGWDTPSSNSKPAFNNKGAPPRGRGRGGFRGGRGSSNYQNNNEQSDRGRRNKVLNGPSRGRGNRGRIQMNRGFGRGRGGGFRRPMDVWDSSKSPNSTSLNHDANSDDWDSEEYTGSLANSQIYTSSGTGNTPTSISNSVIGASNEITASEFEVPKKSTNQIDSNSVISVNNNTHSSPEINSLTITNAYHKQYSSLPEPAISPPLGVRSPPIGANLIMMPPRTERPPMGGNGPITPTQEIRMQRPRPKIPPPSKIPATAVEMPPDSVETNIGLLDVQFGALELNENSAEAVHVSPPTPHHSPSPASSEKLLSHPPVATTDSLLLNESSFSPVRNNGSNSLPPIDLTPKVSDVSPSLYQEATYQTSPYSKNAQQSPSVYSSTYSTGQVTSTSSIIYSSSSSQSTYSSTTGGVYGGISSSYPQQYQYNNYPSQQNQSLPMLTNSSNSYQFETSQPSVNLSSISHSGSINPAPTLLSGSQSTPTSKQSISSMGKNAVVTNMPPGVPPLVGTQYIMGQGGIPYFQQPAMFYEDLQLMQQQRLPPHISTGYYEMGYPASTTREQYSMNDGRFARADNTSPVQATSINQQSGSQAHQQPMMNPTAIPPAYAYFYGGSATMIPGNFQYGAPTLYPVAAGGTTSGHSGASSGVYGKGPNNFTGNYGGNYDNNQGNNNTAAGDFKSSTSSGPKVQPTQSGNPSTNSDLSYEKQGFHCATPPPFNLGSQNSGMGPGGGYPQHLFIPAMTPHHNTTTLMHQPIHQDGTNTMSGRSQGGTQQPKVVMTKANYSPSTYWTQN